MDEGEGCWTCGFVDVGNLHNCSRNIVGLLSHEMCARFVADSFSANIQNIVDQYKAGNVGSAFACADNSGSVS